MSLRTKSRARQWGAWLISAFVAVTVYVVVFRVFFGDGAGDLLGAMQQRVLLPILVAFGFLAYEMRWDGIVRNRAEDEVTKAVDVKDPAPVVEAKPQDDAHEVKISERPIVRHTVAPEPVADLSSGSWSSSKPWSEEPVSATGEEEYVQARSMVHQEVPDYWQDGDYLKLLGKSAERNYPKALAKLGDYAMRRCAWVEAYYWLWRAQHAGMQNVDPMLRSIRNAWAMDGYPDEDFNVHALYPAAAASCGRALINLESGRETALSKAYLKEHHPAFLTRSGVANKERE